LKRLCEQLAGDENKRKYAKAVKGGSLVLGPRAENPQKGGMARSKKRDMERTGGKSGGRLLNDKGSQNEVKGKKKKKKKNKTPTALVGQARIKK